MAKRSLQASLVGVQRAKRAFSSKGWTQENLAGEVNLKTRQPIWRLFTGQPVDRQVFMDVCHILDLDWRDIANNPPENFPDPDELSESTLSALDESDIDELVTAVRSQHRETIQQRCGILQLLDIHHPVNLDDIYVDVNILKELASQQWGELTTLNNLALTEFARVGLGAVERSQIPGMEAVETYAKLRVLGKPGVGKTTFLQHLAVQCDCGEFAAEQVPIFLALREFAEAAKRQDDFSLFNYIQQTFPTSGLADPSTLETLLQAGRVLLLMDGMDEVSSADITLVVNEIRRFADKYHRNRFVVSCRTTAHKFCLRGFTDVEIAPFTRTQIQTFAQKWFRALSPAGTRSGSAPAAQFMQTLDLPENWPFRQLVATPLFLHLACWMFQGDKKFPSKRTAFYKKGLNLLLGKWDETKGVARDDIYRGFLLPQKMRLLSQLAADTFEQGQYFFEQRTIERYIEDYLQELSGLALAPESLQLESEAILKAIEAQHGLLIERVRGIFSFSYLAFQEYLTARKIVATHNLRSQEQALDGLVSHITDPHWHEVFLLTVTMLRSADSLVQLMKQKIDGLVATDPYLQDFLQWVNQTSQAIPQESQLATIRGFYLTLIQPLTMAVDFTLPAPLDQDIVLDAALENLLQALALDHSQDAAYVNTCRQAFNSVLAMVQDAGFDQALRQLQAQLPSPQQTQARRQAWWQENYTAWVAQLKAAIAHYRNIHHPWQFTPEQEQTLKHYYSANQLLVDCLNSNCEVTAAIREEIESTLFLSQRELVDREWE
ncbi:NACHT domain-containing NTPase [Halomicronema sp. CCY15110]|uniref:NACHT domain-containing protein n=1 Tax=Halomicronema sp. CCY15110 TaxID=2767773 RepID=UPI00194E509B|nr:NACHT domain-containing NTPase [Halomicronema sp. CCY15110]